MGIRQLFLVQYYNMYWIVAAFIVFINATVLYLTLRKIKSLAIPNEILSLAFFLVPALVLFVLSFLQGLSFTISPIEALTLLLVATFLWLGNATMLKSLATAPNPGYTLLISKSYAVLTTLVAPILFGSTLNLKSVVAIVMVVFFCGFIMLEKRLTLRRGPWVSYALMTFGFWSIPTLLLTAMKDVSLSSFTMLMYIALFYSLIEGVEIGLKKISLRSIGVHFFWLLIVSFSALFINLFLIIGYRVAPNPGFIDIANTASVAAIAFLAAVFYGDELTPKKSVGIVGVIGGLILLLI